MTYVRVIAGMMLLAASLGALRAAQAHDFWLVPDAFQIADGMQLSVRGQTSSNFPTSESAVTPERVTEARVIGASDDVRVTDVGTSGTSLLLRNRPRGAGQRIVAVSLAPRLVRASGPEFRRYMELEGAAELAKRYEREGILPKTDSITRRYAKYAKTIVEVGSGGARAYSIVVGQPAEFVPLSDPGALRAGDTLRIRLVYAGVPLSAAHVEAGLAPAGGSRIDLALETDANGIVRVPVGRAGLWNVRSLHIVPAPHGSGADWDSHFVTFVFRVR